MRLMKSINSKNLKQQLGKVQNIAYTDPLTQNNLAHAALDGTILDSNLLVEVLQELYDKGAQFDQPNIYGHLPINFAVTNDIPEAINWFFQKNPRLLLYIHPEYHMSLAHCAVAEKSFSALKALIACQPQLINQVITEGDFENYAPINYFLAMLVSKIDFRLDQYLPPDHVIDHGIIEEYERSKKEPAQKIIDDNDNIKCITDFLLEESSIDTFFVPTKFGSVLHVLVRLSYFDGLETVIKRLKSKEESSSLQKILDSKDSDNKSPLFCALERSVDGYRSARCVLNTPPSYFSMVCYCCYS